MIIPRNPCGAAMTRVIFQRHETRRCGRIAAVRRPVLIQPAITDTIRYDVFISYRHKELDTTWANWLVRQLEGYKPPGAVRASLSKEGRAVRIKKVFRDEDEASAGGDLSEALKDALRQSRNLVVICSRDTPGSRWVDDEIRYFSSLGRGTRIIPFLVDGEPDESFPIAIRGREDGLQLGASSQGVLQFEPLAADVRPRKGLSVREIKRRALLKVVAGALDVQYDALYQRDSRRRRHRWIAAGLALSLSVTGGASWFAWTRTDKYQVEWVLGVAPTLLPSSQGDDLYTWCRALALTGRFDQAVQTARATGTFGGDRVKALITVADAATELKRDMDAEELMVEAADAARGYQPEFGLQMRREVTAAFMRQGRPEHARNYIKASVTASRDVSDINVRVIHLSKFAGLLLALEGKDYAAKLREYDDTVFRTVGTVVGVEAALKEGKSDEANRLTSQAIAFSQEPGARAHAPYLLAWTVETTAAAGVTALDPALAQRALQIARQMPAGDAKSVTIRQIVAALCRMDKPEDASPLLESILDDDGRRTASETVARAFTKKGNTAAALQILEVYQKDDLDRYSIVSSIGEGLGDNYQLATLSTLDAALPGADQLEVRVNAIAALRKAGKSAEAGELLASTLQMAQEAAGQSDSDEVLSRIGEELLAAGRDEQALALARKAADQHTRTFSLIAIAKDRLSRKREDGVVDLLTEAAAAEAKVPDDDLRAAGYREIGRILRSMGRPEAMDYFRRAVTEATKGGQYGSDTVADVAEEFAAAGQLYEARTIADRYCEDADRLRVYAALVLKYFGVPTRKIEFEDEVG